MGSYRRSAAGNQTLGGPDVLDGHVVLGLR